MAEDVSIRIEADAAPFIQTLNELKGLSSSFGSELTGALRSAAVSGRSLDDVLRRIGSNLAGRALSMGLSPLGNLASNLFGSMMGGANKVVPFAKGGVVSTPSYFPLGGGGTGVMGEAGAEAILPLARGADGRLGVAGAGGGGAVNVTFNITTPDAASFRKSEAQITGLLAQAVSRGARNR